MEGRKEKKKEARILSIRWYGKFMLGTL